MLTLIINVQFVKGELTAQPHYGHYDYFECPEWRAPRFRDQREHGWGWGRMVMKAVIGDFASTLPHVGKNSMPYAPCYS
jgi:hypothetical protein